MCSTWPRNEAQVVLRLVSSPTCLIIGCTVELYRVYTDLLWMNATWMATTGLIPRPQLASFSGHNWPHSQATTGFITSAAGRCGSSQNASCSDFACLFRKMWFIKCSCMFTTDCFTGQTSLLYTGGSLLEAMALYCCMQHLHWNEALSHSIHPNTPLALLKQEVRWIW